MRERNRARGTPVPAKVVAAQLREAAEVRRAARGRGLRGRASPRARSSSCRPRSCGARRPPRASRRIRCRSSSGCSCRASAGRPSHRADARRRGARGRGGGLHEPVADGPLPADPAGRARVGGHARELHDARVPRRRDERIRLGTLVTGVTYRNLAHLAKVVATLDVVSGGRALCGLGAAWFEREHRLYGWAFPPLAERYALLEDALELLPLMWGPGSPRFEGRTVTVAEATSLPAAAAGAHPDPRRRLRRAAHAAARGAPRGRVQPVRRPGHGAAQARRPAVALRGGGARPGGDRGHAPRAGARRRRRASRARGRARRPSTSTSAATGSSPRPACRRRSWGSRMLAAPSP